MSRRASAAVMTAPQVVCPICDGRVFVRVGSRTHGSCAQCGAKERTRLLGALFKQHPPKSIGLPVVHFAPEQSISRILSETFGALYTPADFSPDLYANIGMPVRQVDLSKVREHFKPRSLGGVVHSHVLEHVRAPVDRILSELNDSIAPGGFHVLQVPIERGWYREDLDPDMPDADRTRRFMQHDHVRLFGADDFEDRLIRHFRGFDRVPMTTYFTSAQAKAAGIPGTALTRHTSHSVYLFVKRG